MTCRHRYCRMKQRCTHIDPRPKIPLTAHPCVLVRLSSGSVSSSPLLSPELDQCTRGVQLVDEDNSGRRMRADLLMSCSGDEREYNGKQGGRCQQQVRRWNKQRGVGPMPNSVVRGGVGGQSNGIHATGLHGRFYFQIRTKQARPKNLRLRIGTSRLRQPSHPPT